MDVPETSRHPDVITPGTCDHQHRLDLVRSNVDLGAHEPRLPVDVALQELQGRSTAGIDAW